MALIRQENLLVFLFNRKVPGSILLFLLLQLRNQVIDLDIGRNVVEPRIDILLDRAPVLFFVVAAITKGDGLRLKFARL